VTKSKQFGPTEWVKLFIKGKDFLHPTFLNLHPTKFSNFENILYSGNEKLELKIIHSGKVDPEEIIVFQK